MYRKMNYYYYCHASMVESFFYLITRNDVGDPLLVSQCLTPRWYFYYSRQNSLWIQYSMKNKFNNNIMPKFKLCGCMHFKKYIK